MGGVLLADQQGDPAAGPLPVVRDVAIAQDVVLEARLWALVMTRCLTRVVPMSSGCQRASRSDIAGPPCLGSYSGMRIKYIIPFPFDVGQEIRAAQVPDDVLGTGTEVECVPVRNTATLVDCYYEDLIFEMFIVEAGLRAEAEGFDAVVMDTVSDSGLWALRSRLSIPVLGPGLVSYVVAIMLGRRFSIITMWDQWRHLYETNLDKYKLWSHCASIRSVGIPS